MVAKPLRTKPKSASAERCLRSLGATIDMATPDMETSNCSCEGYIVAWRFTKRQPGGRGDYWVLSLSGNCCSFFKVKYSYVTRTFPTPASPRRPPHPPPDCRATRRPSGGETHPGTATR